MKNVNDDVRSVGMFSKNEHYDNLNPSELKFLLVPYIQGCMELLRTECKPKRFDRFECCQLAQQHFGNFLDKCVSYGFLPKPPDSEDEEDDSQDGVHGGVNKKKGKKEAQRLSSDEKRSVKIQRMLENKELDLKIDTLWKRCANSVSGVEMLFILSLLMLVCSLFFHLCRCAYFRKKSPMKKWCRICMFH
jgi:hypothetical protein